jgi:hypothetical protein
MKVNPVGGAAGQGSEATVNEEKSLLLKSSAGGGSSGGNLQSLSRSRAMRRDDKYKCNKLLKKIVDGKAATVIMSSVTLFALFGVCNSIFS